MKRRLEVSGIFQFLATIGDGGERWRKMAYDGRQPIQSVFGFVKNTEKGEGIENVKVRERKRNKK